MLKLKMSINYNYTLLQTLTVDQLLSKFNIDSKLTSCALDMIINLPYFNGLSILSPEQTRDHQLEIIRHLSTRPQSDIVALFNDPSKEYIYTGQSGPTLRITLLLKSAFFMLYSFVTGIPGIVFDAMEDSQYIFFILICSRNLPEYDILALQQILPRIINVDYWSKVQKLCTEAIEKAKSKPWWEGSHEEQQLANIVSYINEKLDQKLNIHNKVWELVPSYVTNPPSNLNEVLEFIINTARGGLFRFVNDINYLKSILYQPF